MPAKILVVDDELAYRMAMEIILEEAKYEVDIAKTEKEARNKLTENEYNLAIVDLIMDEEGGETNIDSGIELCRFINEKKPELPIIIITVRDDQEAVQRCNEISNIKKYIRKPYRDIQVLASVKQALKVSEEQEEVEEM